MMAVAAEGRTADVRFARTRVAPGKCRRPGGGPIFPSDGAITRLHGPKRSPPTESINYVCIYYLIHTVYCADTRAINNWFREFHFPTWGTVFCRRPDPAMRIFRSQGITRPHLLFKFPYRIMNNRWILLF